jgi:hypothetical protein
VFVTLHPPGLFGPEGRLGPDGLFGPEGLDGVEGFLVDLLFIAIIYNYFNSDAQLERAVLSFVI